MRGRVLVIDGDEGASADLKPALEAKDFDVELRSDARSGFTRACELIFDCIVCAMELPDIDGVWVARRIRTEPGSVAKTPIVFVGAAEDPEERTRALAVGGDVYVSRPVSNEALVSQVGATVSMSRRIRGVSDAPPSSASAMAALRGDLSLFPLASILIMLEMERRSGTVDAVSGSGTRARLLVVEGLFSLTEIAGESRPALEVLREVLSWRAGRFAFSPRDSEHLGPPRASVGAVVLEAMRLEDEKRSSARVVAAAPPAAPPASPRKPPAAGDPPT